MNSRAWGLGMAVGAAMIVASLLGRPLRTFAAEQDAASRENCRSLHTHLPQVSEGLEGTGTLAAQRSFLYYVPDWLGWLGVVIAVVASLGFLYAIGAAGPALLAAGPVGLLVAAPAGLAVAAAITSALAAFGPGGMVGGMALAGSLIGVGSGTIALTTLPSGISADMVRTQCVRVMSFALAQRELAIPGPAYNGWYLLVRWDSSLSAERERLATLSDDDSAAIKSIDANRPRTPRSGASRSSATRSRT